MAFGNTLGMDRYVVCFLLLRMAVCARTFDAGKRRMFRCLIVIFMTLSAVDLFAVGRGFDDLRVNRLVGFLGIFGQHIFMATKAYVGQAGVENG